MHMTYSSNSEDSLLKSEGPFRITSSGTSFAGPVLPQGQSVSKTIIHGKTNLYGKQIAPREDRSIKEKK
jgi:hypothetical protein